MIHKLIGKIGLEYALRTPSHRGKFRLLNLLDILFGPFHLHNAVEGMRLTVFLSSLMDVSYFRTPSQVGGPSSDHPIDEIAPKLIRELRTGEVFIDVGANIGFLSIIASRQVGADGLVIAFEPSGREYGRLLSNLEVNHATNVLPIHAALSDCSGIAAFEVASHHTGLNRLSSLGSESGLRTKVPVFNGAECLTALLPDRSPALVKIDVEGAEVHVLRGLKPYLRKHLPANVVVEVTPRFLASFGTSREELYVLMREIGYQPLFNYTMAQYDEVFQPCTNAADS